ncbi:MAG: hypothetical protein H7227_05155 [Actinobacteria bacterium]|nr:hypothetical protein [Actinomycetota bacterium]
MVAYATIAVGLINFRYQTGSSGNLPSSLTLIIPGLMIFLVSLTSPGKQWLQNRNASLAIIVVGGLLLAYSFIL